MLTDLQVKAQTLMNFRNMGGFDEEKARAHAGLSAATDGEIAEIQAEIDKLNTMPEERSAKVIGELRSAIDRLTWELEVLGSRVERIEEAPRAQPSLPKGRKRKSPNLSDEERKRRADRMREIQARNRSKPEPTTSLPQGVLQTSTVVSNG